MAIIESDETGRHVLLVEGATSMLRDLGRQLRDRGVEPSTPDSVESALELLGTRRFVVVIVDLVLPDGSGLEVLDAVRASGSAAHVIVVSGSGDVGDRTTALDRGADDYLVEPFLLHELMSRVLAVGQWADPEAAALLVVGPLEINLRARQVRDGDRLLELTGREFDLLAFLAARPGHVVSRTELLRAVWQSTPEWQQAATVTEHIRRLRAKIEIEPRHPQILRTVRGSGYRLDLPGTVAPESDPGTTFDAGTIIHVAGRVVSADRAAGAMLGPTSGAELVGRQISELAVPASCRTQLIDLERTDGTEISVEVASEQTTWEGAPAGQVTLTHVPDRSGWLRGLVTGVLSDVNDAVMVTDLHFHLRSWNRAAERLYGWCEHEVVGRHILDVVQPGDDTRDDDALRAAWEQLEDCGRWTGEGHHRARDGSVVDVSSCATLVRDHSGEPILVVVVSRAAQPPVPTSGTAVLADGGT